MPSIFHTHIKLTSPVLNENKVHDFLSFICLFVRFSLFRWKIRWLDLACCNCNDSTVMSFTCLAALRINVIFLARMHNIFLDMIILPVVLPNSPAQHHYFFSFSLTLLRRFRVCLFIKTVFSKRERVRERTKEETETITEAHSHDGMGIYHFW